MNKFAGHNFARAIVLDLGLGPNFGMHKWAIVKQPMGRPLPRPSHADEDQALSLSLSLSLFSLSLSLSLFSLSLSLSLSLLSLTSRVRLPSCRGTGPAGAAPPRSRLGRQRNCMPWLSALVSKKARGEAGLEPEYIFSDKKKN